MKQNIKLRCLICWKNRVIVIRRFCEIFQRKHKYCIYIIYILFIGRKLSTFSYDLTELAKYTVLSFVDVDIVGGLSSIV